MLLSRNSANRQFFQNKNANEIKGIFLKKQSSGSVL